MREWREMSKRVVQRDDDGQTMLHLACNRGNSEEVMTLLQYGSDINACDNGGWTPIHNSCLNGYSNILAILLQYGSNVDPSGHEGETPLHDSVANGHSDCVSLLLQYGADPTKLNSSGLAPYDLISSSDTGLVKELLAYPTEHWQPFKCAEFRPEIIDAVKKTTANPPVSSKERKQEARFNKRETVPSKPGWAWTGLEKAPSSREEKKLEFILERLKKDEFSEPGESKVRPRQLNAESSISVSPKVKKRPAENLILEEKKQKM